MKHFYQATATIQDGEFEYWDVYPLPTPSRVPSIELCLNTVIDYWYADESPAVRSNAFITYYRHGYAELPCGRYIVDVGYDLDYQRMVEHDCDGRQLALL